MLYLRDTKLWPLQLVLRGILNASKIDLNVTDAETLAAMRDATELLKYGVIVVSSGPVLVAYPFVQKYFQGLYVPDPVDLSDKAEDQYQEAGYYL